jgi:uncharacterized DUF497 family protein
MKLSGFIWLDTIIDKLAKKHPVTPEEVEAVFLNSPKFRFVENGDREGENVYMALGRSEGGRYLTVLFIRKANGLALILSARDMAEKERKLYERK